jgi:hypothetical protein
MTHPLARSSDLERAKRLTWRLLDPAAGSEATPEVRGYVRLGARPEPARPPAAPAPSPARAPVVAAAVASAAPPAIAPALPAPTTADSWRELLRWCCQAASGTNAFVVDSQGFVVAHEGTRPFVDIEDLGSQLVVTIGRADQTEVVGPALSLHLEYPTLRVTATRLSVSMREPLLLVLETQSPLSPALQQFICEQVTATLPRL